MAENSGQNPVRLEFSYRRAGMGGVSDTIILSPETKKPLKSILEKSRSGKHGRRIYYLQPGKKYIMYEVTRSNSGNVFIYVKEIEVKADGVEIKQEWRLFEGNTITTFPSQLPGEINDILMSNKDALPLFEEYYIEQVNYLSQ